MNSPDTPVNGELELFLRVISVVAATCPKEFGHGCPSKNGKQFSVQIVLKMCGVAFYIWCSPSYAGTYVCQLLKLWTSVAA